MKLKFSFLILFFINSNHHTIKENGKINYPTVIDVRIYGAKGDGINDDSNALQLAIDANPGKYINFGTGFTYLISKSLVLQNYSTYYGKSTIIAKPNLGLVNTPLLLSSSKSHVIVKDLVLDCNANKNGMGIGLKFDSGNNNLAENLTIRNSYNSGIQVESERDTKISYTRIENCGRKGYTDNHGIMIYSISSLPVQNIQVLENTLINIFRKGITTYSRNGGIVRNILIKHNRIQNCGLGGIYIGGAEKDNKSYDIKIEGNTISNCYQNVSVYNTVNLLITRNKSSMSFGADGIGISEVQTGIITWNIISGSATTGLNIINTVGASRNLTISNNKIINSNRQRIGYAPGVNLSEVINSTISDNIIYDTHTPQSTFGIYENSGSKNNTIKNNTITNVKIKKLVSFGR